MKNLHLKDDFSHIQKNLIVEAYERFDAEVEDKISEINIIFELRSWKTKAGECGVLRKWDSYKIGLSKYAFQNFSKEKMKAVVIHELIHALIFNKKEDKHGHGMLFETYANMFEGVKKKCSEFAKDIANYKIECKGCGENCFRHRESKTIRNIDHYNCNLCGNNLKVEKLNN